VGVRKNNRATGKKLCTEGIYYTTGSRPNFSDTTSLKIGFLFCLERERKMPDINNFVLRNSRQVKEDGSIVNI
jgi:hypothetical protein